MHNQTTRAQPSDNSTHHKLKSELMTSSTGKDLSTLMAKTANKQTHLDKVVTPVFCNNKKEEQALNAPSSPRAL